jgi:hypothetical protein
MRVLVQDCQSHAFHKRDGGWTLMPSEGADFQSSLRALEFAALDRERAMRIVLDFGNNKLEVIFPGPQRASGNSKRIT